MLNIGQDGAGLSANALFERDAAALSTATNSVTPLLKFFRYDKVGETER